MRWVHRYVPEFERRWNRFARPVGRSWRVDETYVKSAASGCNCTGRWIAKGTPWTAVRAAGRDVAATKAFFRQAMKSQGSSPATITLDGYAASHRAVREMKADGELNGDTKVRSSKYLNNLIEQDHRSVKSRLDAMRGLRRFTTATIVIAGIELVLRIKKGQFNLGRPHLKDRRAPATWEAVLSA
jgi:transposase-like protein